MLNNADALLLYTVKLAKLFLGHNLRNYGALSGDEEIVPEKGEKWPATLSFWFHPEKGLSFDFEMELNRNKDGKKLLVTAMKVKAGTRENEREDDDQHTFLTSRWFKLAFGKDNEDAVWVIEKPIDIIAFFKTYNQLSLDLGYTPILKS